MTSRQIHRSLTALALAKHGYMTATQLLTTLSQGRTPDRASNSGPSIPSRWVECGNCGRFSEPDPSDETQARGPLCQNTEHCGIRLCASCEDDCRCFNCGRHLCTDHSRPNPGEKGRICASCEL